MQSPTDARHRNFDVDIETLVMVERKTCQAKEYTGKAFIRPLTKRRETGLTRVSG